MSVTTPEPLGAQPLDPLGAISTDSSQGQAQVDLNSLAQNQAAEEARSIPPDHSHGWSLTNPFQDIGQVWHDVETHTVAPVFHAAHWLYTYAIARPYSTIATLDAKNNYDSAQGKGGDWFSGSQWAQAWNASAHISPGQAWVMAANNNSAFGQGVLSQGDLGSRVIDPESTQQVDRMFRDPSAPNAWGAKIASGSFDAALGWYADPTSHLSKGVKILKGIKDVPISRADSEAEAMNKLQAPRSQKFDEWAVGKPAGVLAEHPMVAGTGARANPFRYQAAALIAGAKNPQEVNLIRQIMAGVPSAIQGMEVSLGDVAPVSKALDKLAGISEDAATQVSNLMMPPEVMEKYALTANSWDEKEQWLQKASQAKAKGAEADLNANPEKAQQILDLRGQLRARTATTAVADRLAEIRGNLKYANTRNTDGVSFIHNALYNFPIRIYQGLVDRPEGLINHKDDQAVEYARSWLNKSSTLSPEDKNSYLQRYASATPAQRQHTWNSIESDVYKQVGAKYDIDPGIMDKILTTTRTKSGNLVAYARSKAYGTVKLGEDDHTVLPTPDSEVILHPKLITQIEGGAVPMANLHNLENALEAADREGMIGKIVRGKINVGDQINNMLESVYSIWKPMSLITGHRAYNHIGDDWLRGLAKIGGLATVQHAVEGTANFMRNRFTQATRNVVARNTQATHDRALWQAKAEYDGLLAQYKDQKASKFENGGIPDSLRVTPAQLAEKKSVYDGLKSMKLDEIQTKHRLGEGTFKIAGSNIDWPEAFGGPNGDWARLWTSSHPTWGALADDAAHRNHSIMTALRTRNFGTISAVDDVAKHTRAYVHYVRNQLMPDPVGKMVVNGTPLNDVANWLRGTAAGRAHMKALHIGDASDHVSTVAEMVKTYLPSDAMREAASKGKFDKDIIQDEMPNAGIRPDIHADINLMVHGGDPTVNALKRWMDVIMKWTGTMPDDIMVRHPVFNSLYKSRLSDDVQSWMSMTGNSKILPKDYNALVNGAMTGARKDMQNLLYDVSRFNDMGHTLRFISPFFNAWFNAMSSWSKLFMQNPQLLGRTYQAKRLLWNSPFTVNTDTGQKADVNTPWDKTAFVFHMPKSMQSMFGGLTEIPIDAKTIVSPTYIDSIGNPGFGPLVAMPVNAMVKQHPAAMNSPIVQSMLGGFINKNDLQSLIPSGVRDAVGLSQLLIGNPNDNSNYAKTVWSIWQEQMYDYMNGQRASKPVWSDVENQANYLTRLDYFVNRLSPLGFKPAPDHQFFVDEYKRMLAQDPKNAQQNFYDKYGPAAMMFTQSLSTNPSGIPATVGASVAAKKYKDILSQFPELGAVVVGPEGNGNFDDLAYQWQVAEGLRQQLTPREAASQAMINLGWAQYGKARTAVQAQLQARNLKSINQPGARDLKQWLSNYVGTFADPGSKNYNRDFYINYASFNQNAYQERISGLLTIAQDPKLLANGTRSDIRSLQAYSQLRDTTYAALQKRQSKSLTAAANFDIAKHYDEQVAQMMMDDTKFAQLYERYLAKDDFKEPV